ncbi:MAG: tetratricopeptide repeat protein [Bacteroidetes bacterium]|nr:tetratricopeptide repeat protein [Bacteroidota bacterium]
MRVLLSGEKAEISEGEFYVPQGKDLVKNTKRYNEKLKKLLGVWQSNKDIDSYSDYGVILIYLGRYQEAKNVFEEIEKIEPNRYATAANIGTLYELMGKNELALKWISRAIELNPRSHNSSEWLHAKILEAKINGDEFITADFLLNTNFGNNVIPTSSKTREELEKLSRQILYQLDERMTFIKPKDKIVALLLFELGNTYAITSDITISLRVYDKAIEYGYTGDVLDKRYKKFLSLHEGMDNEYGVLQDKENSKAVNNSNRNMVLTFVAMILLLAVIVFIVKRQSQ